jgi:hypothetical protein
MQIDIQDSAYKDLKKIDKSECPSRFIRTASQKYSDSLKVEIF